MLAIYRHDYEQPFNGFPFDWWVLIRPRTGTKIGPIGDLPENDVFRLAGDVNSTWPLLAESFVELCTRRGRPCGRGLPPQRNQSALSA